MAVRWRWAPPDQPGGGARGAGGRFQYHRAGRLAAENVSWTRAQHRISAWGADTATARLLDVKPGTACLVIERLTWRGEQPITRVRQVFLGMPGTWSRASRRAR